MLPNQLADQVIAKIRSKDFAGAKAILQGVLARAPTDFEALQLLGTTESLQGNPSAAIPLFTRALGINEQQPNVHLNLSHALAATGSYDLAVTHACRAVQLQPALGDACLALCQVLQQASQWQPLVRLSGAIAALFPAKAVAHEYLGTALKKTGELQKSLESLLVAKNLNGRSYTVHHNLGETLLSLGDYEGATKAYEQALAINPKSQFSWIGLGHAKRAQGLSVPAKDAYESALRLNEQNVDAHRLYNEMTWQTGDERNYLVSYRRSIARVPDNLQLKLSFANELLKVQAYQEADGLLQSLLSGGPSSPMLHDLVARTKAGLGDFEAALKHHAIAVDDQSLEPGFLQNHIETLLRFERHEEGARIARKGLDRLPLHQGLWALYSKLLSLTDEKEFLRVCDYGQLVRPQRLAAPDGFGSVEDFCHELGTHLDLLHGNNTHPTDQTVRGGSQTFGSLFNSNDPLVEKLVLELKKLITRFVDDFPRMHDHPFYSRARSNIRFSGSWSVKLKSGGFHTNHYHPEGWMSSALYISVPQTLQDEQSQPGWLKFGETNLQLGRFDTIVRTIQPRVGQLVLFPSYCWHGTIPFESTDPRTTVAFDVLPS